MRRILQSRLSLVAIANLSVKNTTGGTYAPLSNTTADTVTTKATKSPAGGDSFSNDYQIQIPFVNSDTYSVGLNYVAATQ